MKTLLIILSPIIIINLVAFLMFHYQQRNERRQVIAMRMEEMIEEAEKGRN